jgi:hypothetical protein
MENATIRPPALAHDVGELRTLLRIPADGVAQLPRGSHALARRQTEVIAQVP